MLGGVHPVDRPPIERLPLWVIIACAAATAGIAMGVRQAMGLYVKPVSDSMGIGIEAFSISIAIANIVWGAMAPIMGAVSDKYGSGRIVITGGLATVCGLWLLLTATSDWQLYVAGIFLGIGVSGSGINALVGAVARVAGEAERTAAIAKVGMGSGIGILIALPYSHFLIDAYGWQTSLAILAVTALAILPLAWPVSGKPTQAATVVGTKSDVRWHIIRNGRRGRPMDEAEFQAFIESGRLLPTDLLWRKGFDEWRQAFDVFPPLAPGENPPRFLGAPRAVDRNSQTLPAALKEAAADPSFWLLNLGFFVCGFHVVFYATHLPAYVGSQGLAGYVAVVGLTVVGLGNLAGTYISGWWGKRGSKRWGLSFIYFARALVFVGFLYLPINELTIIALSGALGLLWLSTIPLTSGLVAVFYGPKWMSMIYGLVFFSHQIGSFLGAWLAGRMFDQTQSYDMMWWISVALGIFAALVHVPIREAPVAEAVNRGPRLLPAE